MTFSSSLKTVVLPLALILTLTLPGATPIAQAQYMGPEPPREVPEQPAMKDKLKDSFKKFFAPGENADGEATDVTKDGEDKNTNFDKPKTNAQTVPFKPDPRNPETWGNDPKYPEKAPKEVKEAPPPAPKRPPMLTQPPLTNAKIEDPVIDANRPPKQSLRLDNPANPLGFADAVAQIRKVENLIKEKRLSEARTTLIPLRQWLIDCTEAHINLYATLNKVPTARAQAEMEKQIALEFAMLRDRAMFELGLLYVEEKEHKKAVKELVEVIKSQPKSKTGILAYELLQEIGFTEQLQLAQPDAAKTTDSKPKSPAQPPEEPLSDGGDQ